MGSGVPIKKARNKYGLSSFVKEIVADCDIFDDMNDMEKQLVQLSDCYPVNQMSYNLKEGGWEGRLNEESRKIAVEHWHEAMNNRSETEKAEFSELKRRQSRNIWKTDEHRRKWHNAISRRTDEQKRSTYIKWKASMDNKTIEQKKGLSQKLSRSQKTYYQQHPEKDLLHSTRMSGSRNPMFEHSAPEYMTEEQIQEWKENLSKANSGENNPAYGRKWMHLNGSNDKKDRIYVHSDEVEKYLSLGYVFGMKERLKR